MPWKNIYLHIHAAFKSIFPLIAFYKYLYLVSGKTYYIAQSFFINLVKDWTQHIYIQNASSLPVVQNNKTVITQASHVLTDRTTDWAWTGLTSPIGREGVQFC